jgi:hypothetical protein
LALVKVVSPGDSVPSLSKLSSQKSFAELDRKIEWPLASRSPADPLLGDIT